MSPAETAKTAQLPAGFALRVFAHEPEVVQPVAMTLDDRGRLWVVECETYADLKTNFDTNRFDRITIFEDTDGDGRADRRKVFWDRGQRVTSVALGFDGVWVLCAPYLVFLPDRNKDDVPDGPPEVLLEGWNAGPVRHNIVNGLKWGPDGWLYGRHGIQATSTVGAPGARDAERTRLNCAIWRYHPTRRVFEVVCQGGTNPWGHDWNEEGELFFINTVIGHLWHGIPGAYYRRMYGEHLQPRRYGLIDQHADHYHWDTGRSWNDSANAGSGVDALGGGHAHSGLMIYLGGAWPAPYAGGVFTLNFHGRRVNHDRLERQGSGYVGRHAPDMVKFADPWFRGVDLAYGPDGEVYILDWSDTGECHENDADGVHRETGRIYQLRFTGAGASAVPATAGDWNGARLRQTSLADADQRTLAALQGHRNEWFVRQARRVLQERAAAGQDLSPARQLLKQQFDKAPETKLKLRALWALHGMAAAPTPWLMEQLEHPEPAVRLWAVRLLTEKLPDDPLEVGELGRRLTALAQKEPEASVRLSLASALQRLPVSEREALALALLNRAEDNHDHNLPLMLWYGIEPLASADSAAALRLAAASKIRLPRQYLARRLAEEWERTPGPVNQLVALAARSDTAGRSDILRGLAEAWKGWRKAARPEGWDDLARDIQQRGPEELRALARELGVLFGDGRALEELRALALNGRAEAASRVAALRQLMDARPKDLQGILEKLLNDPVTAGTAARGLAQFDDADIPGRILRHFDKMNAEDRAAVVGRLAERPASAMALLEAVGRGQVPRHLVNAFHARQIQAFKQPELTRKLTEVWGEVRSSDAAKQEQMKHYRALLTMERLAQADRSRGRELFGQLCGVCHTLYGEGANIGPDLTGAGRQNLEYLLENLIDPSAMVAADYKVSQVYLKDDREFSAVVLSQTERTITLQTPNEKLTLPRAEVLKIQPTEVSLMPEGLLEGLSVEQLRDLMGYLMHTNQVPLPAKP